MNLEIVETPEADEAHKRAWRELGEKGNALKVLERVQAHLRCYHCGKLQAKAKIKPHGLCKACAGLSRFQKRVRDSMPLEKLQEGRLAKMRAGYWVQGFAPFGYHRCKTEGGYVLKPLRHEAVVVQFAFRLILDGRSVVAARRILNARKRLWRRGHKWSSKTFKSMLCNRVYLGLIQVFGEWRRGLHAPIIAPLAFKVARLNY